MSLVATQTTTRGAGLVRGDALRVPLRDGSVHLGITSPPYFALRSYQDDGEHYAGQIGSEPRPVDFLLALWAVADEMHRVLADNGSMWWNLGDKMGGSGGRNNSAISSKSTLKGNGHTGGGPKIKATRRSAPDRYNQAADVRAKSLMGLPWRFAMGLICPDLYRAPFEPAACWHDDGPGPCRTCPPRTFPQWIGRAEVIWSKVNGLPESVTDRVRRSHEQWFHVTKAPRYFAGIDEIREGYAPGTSERYAAGYNPRKLDDQRIGIGTKLGGDTYGENPLGKLPGSVAAIADDEPWTVPPEIAAALNHPDDSATVWHIPSEPLAVPDHLGVDHFAAFPQEWPRRIILGWSPTGICTACDEGRRAVVDTKTVKSPVHADGSIMGNRNGGPDERGWDGLPRFNREHTITGYTCACPGNTAPTRPAVVLDPFSGTGTVAMVARALGRYGVGIDLSRDYLRLANWRVFQSGHARKTEARTNRERQNDLFGRAA
jgi:DNA modification methylase